MLVYVLTMGAEAAEGTEAGATVLWVGASLDADLTTLLVHLVGWALAHGCRQQAWGLVRRFCPTSWVPTLFLLSFFPSGSGFPFHPAWDSRHNPGVLQLWTGWPALLHRREYSDSVAQVQFC